MIISQKWVAWLAACIRRDTHFIILMLVVPKHLHWYKVVVVMSGSQPTDEKDASRPD